MLLNTVVKVKRSLSALNNKEKESSLYEIKSEGEQRYDH